MGEWEILGSNDLKAPESAWKLARASEADKPEAWIPAKVPGTVLVSYMDFGAVPDISYANDQEYISDSYFNSDFIYRGTLPFEGAEGRKVFLDFGGINGKADVSLNIYAWLQAQETGIPVEVCCAIGDEEIDGVPYRDIVETAREYIKSIGGFEKFAEWGLVR